MTRTHNKHKESAAPRRAMTMRARLLLTFAVFIVVVIGTMWLFQTFFMDRMYHTVKLRELHRGAVEMEEAIAAYDAVSKADAAVSEDNVQTVEENLRNTAASVAQESNMCVSVFTIRQGYATEVIREHSNVFCFVHNMLSSEQLNRIYVDVQNGGGSFEEEFAVASLFRPDGEDADADAIARTRSVIHAGMNDSGDLLYIINMQIAPLNATVSVLRMQLFLISALMALLGAGLAFALSAYFARPLAKMSGEASRLAMGDYDVHFDGGNCSETVQLSETLNRAAQELSSLDKMQKDLVANISHDLRTPLTMISGYSEMIRDLPGEATPENMQVIIDETARLTSLVNDMLEVSRLQNGAVVLHPARFDLTEVLRETIDRYARLREREGYDIRFEGTVDTPVYVNTDRERILQVVYNLVNNAVNYAGDDRQVIIRQDVTPTEVTISVIDHGIGIPEDKLPLVWERYYKVHDYHKRANMGTGLGLSIVKNILVLANARFGVQSTPGAGSRFWFTLPVDVS